MEPIIPAVDRELLLEELNQEHFLRHTNKGHNEIYIIDAASSPAAMREIGRLREEAFRQAGGGTGESLDIDRFDTMDPPCRQILVWDPENREIVGGYRFICGSDIMLKADGQPDIATSHIFHFSERFINDFLPHTIELGRSFVNVRYQSATMGKKAIYSLDNLWDGLGALTIIYPKVKYMFGKMTMYPSFGTHQRDLILGFLHRHFDDPDHLVTSLKPIVSNAVSDEIQKNFTGNYKEDYRALNRLIRAEGRNIPPLVNAYMSLSPTMRTFGTSINDDFGDVEETGILLTLDDIFEEKKLRHVASYVKECEETCLQPWKDWEKWHKPQSKD